LASDRDDIVKGIAEAIDGKGLWDCGEKEVIGCFVGGNGWDGEIWRGIKENIVKVRPKAIDDWAEDVLWVTEFVTNGKRGIDGLKISSGWEKIHVFWKFDAFKLAI
jgi:hypothetical protein